jgi:hypothetical protein
MTGEKWHANIDASVERVKKLSTVGEAAGSSNTMISALEQV